MLNMENLTKEVGELDMLISAVSNEIAEQLSSNRQGGAEEMLLTEMQEALCELRLERGVRLMLLNAFGTRASRHATGNAYHHTNRRADGPLMRAS
jgi:hypothetical protein